MLDVHKAIQAKGYGIAICNGYSFGVTKGNGRIRKNDGAERHSPVGYITDAQWRQVYRHAVDIEDAARMVIDMCQSPEQGDKLMKKLKARKPLSVMADSVPQEADLKDLVAKEVRSALAELDLVGQIQRAVQVIAQPAPQPKKKSTKLPPAAARAAQAAREAEQA